MKRALMLGAWLLLAACGGKGAIFVTIEARGPGGDLLRIPEDVDELTVKVTDAHGGAQLFQKDYPLKKGADTFPLTLGLEQGSKTSDRVNIEIHALLAAMDVGSAVSLVPINRETTTNVTLRIDQQ